MRNEAGAVEGRKTAVTAPSKALDGARTDGSHCEVRNEVVHPWPFALFALSPFNAINMAQ